MMIKESFLIRRLSESCFYCEKGWFVNSAPINLFAQVSHLNFDRNLQSRTLVDTKLCDRIEVRNLNYLASVMIGMMRKF